MRCLEIYFLSVRIPEPVIGGVHERLARVASPADSWKWSDMYWHPIARGLAVRHDHGTPVGVGSGAQRQIVEQPGRASKATLNGSAPGHGNEWPVLIQWATRSC